MDAAGRRLLRLVVQRRKRRKGGGGGSGGRGGGGGSGGRGGGGGSGGRWMGGTWTGSSGSWMGGGLQGQARETPSRGLLSATARSARAGLDPGLRCHGLLRGRCASGRVRRRRVLAAGVPRLRPLAAVGVAGRSSTRPGGLGWTLVRFAGGVGMSVATRLQRLVTDSRDDEAGGEHGRDLGPMPMPPAAAPPLAPPPRNVASEAGSGTAPRCSSVPRCARWRRSRVAQSLHSRRCARSAPRSALESLRFWRLVSVCSASSQVSPPSSCSRRARRARNIRVSTAATETSSTSAISA